MDQRKEILRLIDQAEKGAENHPGMSLAILCMELRELLGVTDFAGFWKDFDAQGNCSMVEVAR